MSESYPNHARKLAVIGASAGAVDALLQLLPALPGDTALAILVVVHLPPDSESSLASLLDARCRIKVKEAEDTEAICAGTAYIAPPNYHLLVEPDCTLSLSSEEPVLFSRPSIDVLFESAADAYGDSVAGIILTGGNADGAHGLRAIVDGGGVAMVQRPDTAAHPEMPSCALRVCPEARAVTLDELFAELGQSLPDLPR